MRLDVPDLLRPRALPTAVPRALAILGVLLAGVGTFRVLEADGRLAQSTAELEAAGLLAGGRVREERPPQMAAPAPAPRSVRPRGDRAPSSTDDPADTERAALARFLAVDWNHRLLLVEQSGAGIVSLTGLKVDANRDALELRGETPSLERIELLRRRLLQAGVSAVHLSRHETVQRTDGTRVLFVASAEWSR